MEILEKIEKFGDVSLKTGDFEIKQEDERQPLISGVSHSKWERWNGMLSPKIEKQRKTLKNVTIQRFFQILTYINFRKTNAVNMNLF